MKSARKNIPTTFEYIPILELAEHIRSQAVSPVEVVEACLERVKDPGSKLNAFITVLAEQARAQARQA